MSKNDIFAISIKNNASGAIALLFRNIITNNNLKNTLDVLLKEYSGNNSKNSRDKSRIKTNYSSHVKNGEMTIKIFNMLFRDLLSVKEIEYHIDIKIEDKIVTLKSKIDLTVSIFDTVRKLFDQFLDLGFRDTLDRKLETFSLRTTTTNSEKSTAKLNMLQKINGERMSFKSFVEIMEQVFEAKTITITVGINYNKHVLSEVININL